MKKSTILIFLLGICFISANTSKEKDISLTNEEKKRLHDHRKDRREEKRALETEEKDPFEDFRYENPYN